MDSQPSADAVHEAVRTLYHCPDSAQKEMASRWLQAFQKSVFSWRIADEMLTEKRSVESCYFASQTIRSKIQYSFLELPAQAHASLRDSLIEHIRQANSYASPAIVMQLCLAIADLALQMTPWNSPVRDLMNVFGETHLLPMLQILSVLPEEANSSALRLGANRRNEILDSLRSTTDIVTEYMQYCLSNNCNAQIQIKVLNCFASWVSIKAVKPNDITRNIVEQALNILKNISSTPEMHDAATDCLSALFQFLENEHHQCLEMQVLEGVLELEESFLLTIAREDREKSVNLCCVFTEITESFVGKILSKNSTELSPSPLKTIDLVLKCMGHYDYDVVEITFGFWHRLSDELYQKNSESLNNLLKTYVNSLFVYLRRHCEMDVDQKGLLEDGDDFVEFRKKVSELVKDLAFIPGPLNSFYLMFLSLQQPNVTWNFTEATLFLMKSIAKQIFVKENDMVSQVVDSILQMPESTHIAVRYTSVLLLGELCEWLQTQPESIEVTLNFLLHLLQQPQLSTAAAIALQNICCANRDYMAVHFNCLMQIVQFMDTFGISNEAAIGLLKGVSVTLSRLPSDHIQEAMEQICRLQIIQLNHLVENDVKPEFGSITDPIWCFDRLATVFKFVNPQTDFHSVHPCQRVLTELWPLISKACNKFQGDVRVMERCCRCLRFAIRCVGKQSTQILEPLVHQIVSLYQIHNHSCFLYLGSILVDEYGSEPGCVQGLLNMLQVFVNSTMRIFKEVDGLKNNPDTVDDLFRLCARFVQTMPFNFLKADVFPCIWDFAIFACTLDHRDANASVMKYFAHLVHISRYQRDDDDFIQCQTIVKNVLNEKGLELLGTLLRASVFHLHSYMFFDVAEVMLEIKYSDRVAFCKWLQISLQSLPTQNSGGSPTATDAQLSDFYRTLSTAEGAKEISQALREFVRLYR